MKKKIKIGLAYYEDVNLGDVVIYDSVKYLIDKVMKKNNIDYEIKDIDIGNKHLDTVEFPRAVKLYKKVLTKILAFLRRIFKNSTSIIVKQWHLTKYYYYLKTKTIPKLEDVDMIIFAGGGLLKFHKQKFHFVINDITLYAQKHNIPVIFNGVGVEGYDEKDPKCMLLKKAINRECVKAIATRDDIDLLREKYANEKIETILVADSAIYTPETYKISKNKKSNTVGICVIRSEIFKDYLYEVDEEVLLKMFSETIIKLKDKGYDVLLFTNGAQADQDFIEKLKAFMKDYKDFDKMVCPRITTAKKLVQVISNCKIVIGARLHSNIIPYSLGIPIISIVWNNKQLMFSKINEIEEYFITKENFNSDYIISKVDKINNQKMVKKEYKESVYKYLETQIEKIIKNK